MRRVEKIDFAFIRWVWNYRKRVRPKLLAKLEQAMNECTVVIFRKPGDVRSYWKCME